MQLFLSTVSDEFRSYRDHLRHALDRPDVTVKVQEDFIVSGTPPWRCWMTTSAIAMG